MVSKHMIVKYLNKKFQIHFSQHGYMKGYELITIQSVCFLTEGNILVCANKLWSSFISMCLHIMVIPFVDAISCLYI